MNEELRMQRVEQYGSFLYCPLRNTLCFGRYTDRECGYDSCILDDPEYQKLQKTIAQNRKKRNEQSTQKEAAAFVPPSRKTREDEIWREIYKKEAMAAKLYRRNKPKLADGLLMEAMHMRRRLNQERNQNKK